MKTIILISLCLCILATAINADKSHKHHEKLLKSGSEEHKVEKDVQPVKEEETEIKNHKPTHEQTETKIAGSGRKHRINHHVKNKKGGNSEAHTGRSRKAQPKANKHNIQRANNNKHHGHKHGRGKQAQQK